MAKAKEEVIKPKVVEIDCSTGVETVRDMTDEEIAAQEAMRADFEKRAQEEMALKLEQEVARASAVEKLTALGLSQEEINAIIK